MGRVDVGGGKCKVKVGGMGTRHGGSVRSWHRHALGSPGCTFRQAKKPHGSELPSGQVHEGVLKDGGGIGRVRVVVMEADVETVVKEEEGVGSSRGAATAIPSTRSPPMNNSMAGILKAR